jgi:hypothetical protein
MNTKSLTLNKYLIRRNNERDRESRDNAQNQNDGRGQEQGSDGGTDSVQGNDQRRTNSVPRTEKTKGFIEVEGKLSKLCENMDAAEYKHKLEMDNKRQFENPRK